MNRYILTVLYVMAGCAVTVPVHSNTNSELYRSSVIRVYVSYSQEGGYVYQTGVKKRSNPTYQSAQLKTQPFDAHIHQVDKVYTMSQIDYCSVFNYQTPMIRAPGFYSFFSM